MAKILTFSRKSHHPVDGSVFSVHNSENRSAKVKKGMIIFAVLHHLKKFQTFLYVYHCQTLKEKNCFMLFTRPTSKSSQLHILAIQSNCPHKHYCTQAQFCIRYITKVVYLVTALLISRMRPQIRLGKRSKHKSQYFQLIYISTVNIIKFCIFSLEK